MSSNKSNTGNCLVSIHLWVAFAFVDHKENATFRLAVILTLLWNGEKNIIGHEAGAGANVASGMLLIMR